MTANRPLIFGVAISMVYTVATVVDTPRPIPEMHFNLKIINIYLFSYLLIFFITFRLTPNEKTYRAIFFLDVTSICFVPPLSMHNQYLRTHKHPKYTSTFDRLYLTRVQRQECQPTSQVNPGWLYRKQILLEL